MNFATKPILVFWETTRSCPLACVHCRASAILDPLPGELTREEGMKLIDEIASFGRPYPTLVFTGGDPLMRADLFDLISYANSLGVQFAVSPAVTKSLTDEALCRIKRLGASSVSFSLDGAYAQTHDSIRGVNGTFDMTVDRIKKALELGIGTQVNTAVMKSNFEELPEVFHTIRTLGVKVWELFFLVRVGRGSAVADLTPSECESVCNFLYDASRYGVTVRCVEAPFIRRVASERSQGASPQDETYLRLRRRLLETSGSPTNPSTLRPKGTLDGDGVIFVGYDGTIQPGGLLPVTLGNSRNDRLTEAYRDNAVLRSIREKKLNGPCGSCGFRDACGGSRARSYSFGGDPLGSDPACIRAVA
jgi:AdoMet-dependent heme synthase